MLSASDIAEGFSGGIEPVRSSWLYRIGLLLLAGAMLLLPLLYLLLIVIIAVAVYWHATHNLIVLRGVVGLVLALFAYAGPIVVGVVLLLFMLRPLFVGADVTAAARKLAADDEPLLFLFVRKICTRVGAPVPKRIVVDCQVNASVSFGRGIAGLLGRDLVLTIGLPLVAGLSMRQFSAVLAHEFGHFTQGAGIRLSFIIQGVNRWFARTVYTRGRLDRALASDGDSAIGCLALLAQLFVTITRGILWLLMLLGHSISCFMSRQLEYDADRFAARLAGSDILPDLHVRMRVLSVCYEAALSELRAAWAERRLAEDLPDLVLHRARHLSEEAITSIREELLQAGTGLFDTHPSAHDRIVHAQAEAATGVFTVEAPASALFRDFGLLSTAVTKAFYEHALGEDATRAKLVSTPAIAADVARVSHESECLRRYFGDLFPPQSPPPAIAAPLTGSADQQAIVSELRQIRARVAAGRAELSAPAADATQTIDGYARDVMRRLHLALTLAQLPEWRAALPAVDPARIVELHTVLVSLSNVSDQIGSALTHCQGLAAAASEAREARARLLAQRVQVEERELAEVIQTLSLGLQRLPYPFPLDGSRLSVAAFLIDDLPPDRDINDIFRCGSKLVERYFVLYRRLLAELAAAAEAVEAALGDSP